MKVSLSSRFQVQGKSRGSCVCRWPVAGLQQHGRTRIWRAPIPCSRRLQHHPNPWILGIQTPSTLQHLVGRCMLQLPRLHTKGRTCVDSSYFVCNLRYTRLAPLFGVVNTPPTILLHSIRIAGMREQLSRNLGMLQPTAFLSTTSVITTFLLRQPMVAGARHPTGTGAVKLASSAGSFHADAGSFKHWVLFKVGIQELEPRAVCPYAHLPFCTICTLCTFLRIPRLQVAGHLIRLSLTPIHFPTTQLHPGHSY